MKNLICFLLISVTIPTSFSQNIPTTTMGKTVTFSVINFRTSSAAFVQNNGLISNMTTQLPMPDGTLGDFILNETLLSDNKLPNIQTFDGVSPDGKTVLKLTVFPDKMDGLMHTSEGYFIIEPLGTKKDQYLIYGMNEIPRDLMKCGSVNDGINAVNKNGRVLSIAPFPIGTQLRTYRLAAAATGEMTTFYTNQAGAIAQIVSITNASNLIYELEAAIRFQLTTATTGGTIIFTNAATDPFTVDPSFANANNSQAGFTAMNTSNLLPYSTYGVGHTFNTLADLGGGSYSIAGQAGPTPCLDASKARGWTQWTFNAALGAIVNLFVHEVGHQFSAPHTYNAMGGSISSPTFCTGGWSATSAVEPGSGSTIMAYGNNCTSPNYTLSGNNKLNYFHTKSLEFINNAVAGSSGTCITTSATGNISPVANAGLDVIIPKGTPFKLTGTATDANGDAMNYTWEQYDVATANDKGAFGSSILGTGGYYAVNSTTAPLFRSEMSSTALDRTFPKLTHILNSANDPTDNEGEDLPQVARTMKFRFTVRDNRPNGGGVDSDETLVTVTNDGPFLLTSQNTATLWLYNGSNTANITWSVNNTNVAPLNLTNVKISFSTDGGSTFPITLLANTPNNGSATITIPNNLTSQGRIKIEPAGTYAFYDINNVNITISNTCTPEISTITPADAVIANEGTAALNLGLSAYGTAVTNFTGTLAASDNSGTLIGDNAGSCINYSNPTKYDVYPFKVITAGSYTFTISGHPFYTLFNLYSGPINPSVLCTNWLASSFNASGNSIGTTVTKTLAVGTYYIMVSSFSETQPTLPANYVITPSGGTIYNLVPSVGSPYAYTYPVVNSGGNIVAFNDNSNLTNSGIYNQNTFTVYGLSYQGGANLSSYVGTSFSSFQALLTNNTVCGKLSTNSKSVTVNCNAPAQPSPFTASTASVCRGDNNVVYTIPAVTGATSYTWTFSLFGATVSGTSNSVTISFSSSANVGTGILSVTANNGCGVSPARTMNVTVNAVPTQPSAFTTFSSTVCKGNNNVNYTIPVVVGATSYTWTYSGTGATFTGTSNSVTVNFSSTATSGTLSVVANNTCGGSVARTLAITVFSIPTTPTTFQSGNWNVASSWQCGILPTSLTDAIISFGNTITINGVTVQAKNLINNGGSVNFINSGILKLNN